MKDAEPLVGSQLPTQIAAIEGYTYFATRTGAGWAPRNLLAGEVTAEQWRALDALRGRDADISATRALRNALGMPDHVAANLLALLYAHGWVEPAPVKGWQISRVGERMLL